MVGDHGEMLGEHGEQTHGFFIYEPATHVPMIMAGPGLPARSVSDQVRIVDVMPTALGSRHRASEGRARGEPPSARARGKDASRSPTRRAGIPRYHYGWSELRAVQDGRFKYVRAPRPELYDLAHDPSELENQSRDDPGRLDTLARALEDIESRTKNTAAAEGPRPVDPETEERLAALGYVGATVSRRSLEERPRGDPKDKIGLYNLLKQAGTSSVEGRTEEAIARVRQALAADPEIVEAYMLLGNFLKGQASERGHRRLPQGPRPGRRARGSALRTVPRLQGPGPARRSPRGLRAGAGARSEERQGAVAARRPPSAQG